MPHNIDVNLRELSRLRAAVEAGDMPAVDQAYLDYRRTTARAENFCGSYRRYRPCRSPPDISNQLTT